MTDEEAKKLIDLQEDWARWSKLAEIAPPEKWLEMYEHYAGDDRSKIRKERDEWSKLREIAPPEKWMEMYKHYQELLDNETRLLSEIVVKDRAIEIAFETLRQVFKDSPNTKIKGE